MTEYNIAVIGAGSAGLAAVSHLVWKGIDKTIWITEGDTFGAARHRNPETWGSLDTSADSSEFAKLRNKVETRAGTIAWGVFPGFEIATRSASAPELIRAKRLILATGATELARSFPGSDLPGVMTGDGLLRLLVNSGVWPGGRRVAMVGDDQAMISTLRIAIEQFGGELVAVTNDEPVVTARDGVAGSIALADGRATDVDIVAICAGQRPDIGLALMLECATGYSAELGGFVSARSPDMETSVPGVYVCGACAGIGTADQYIGEGVIAAEAAARSLGFAAGDGLSDERFQDVRRDWAERNSVRLAAAASVAAGWRQHRVESVRATSGADR